MNLNRLTVALAVLLSTAATQADLSATGRRTENVILVLVDGLRWQEVFTGADEALLNKENGAIEKPEPVKARFWRESPEARREILMPFCWRVIAKQGQLLGNQHKGCVARVSNGLNFSYPGYSEMIVGFPDPRIDSNSKNLNPNANVFEWLNAKPAFKGKVAVIAAWDVVPYIVNKDRCGFFVNGGTDPITQGRLTPKMELLNQLKRDIPPRWSNEPFDAVTHYSAIEYLRENKPRALWLTFGETDEWGHEGRYEDLLDSIQRTDHLIAHLWETVQSMPEYRDKTTLIVATDHGRGNPPKDWHGHGKDVKGSENIWIAILGPDTPPLGERSNTPLIIQAQIAATVAAAVGEDYCAAVPKAAQPIDGAVSAAKK